MSSIETWVTVISMAKPGKVTIYHNQH
jgi:hypothetical protein